MIVNFTKLGSDGEVEHVGHIELRGNNIVLTPSDSMILRNILGESDRYNGNLEKWMEDLSMYYRSPYLMASEVSGENQQPSEEEVSKDVPVGEKRENVGLDWPASASASESALATGPRSIFNQRTHREP